MERGSFLGADSEAAAGNLLGVRLVDFRHHLLECGAVKSVGEDSSVSDDVLSSNQFLHLSGFHLCLDGVADGVGLGFEFLHHGFVFVQQFNLGKQFDFDIFGFSFVFVLPSLRAVAAPLWVVQGAYNRQC